MSRSACASSIAIRCAKCWNQSRTLLPPWSDWGVGRMTTQATDLRLSLPDGAEVSAFLLRPPDAWLLYVVAHGAGAGMRHPFLERVCVSLAVRGIATFRYQFPYMEAGRKRPDAPSALEAGVRAAVSKAGEIVPELPIVAGGKSLGGRMTSGAAASAPLPRALGLAFLGFPL